MGDMSFIPEPFKIKKSRLNAAIALVKYSDIATLKVAVDDNPGFNALRREIPFSKSG